VVLRVHDACFTSEVLGSLKCDCAEQLQMAMEYIHANAPGIVIYLWQEGRGIGLANKIAAYKLQEQGLDTVDANRALGLPDDSREYTSVRNILKELRVKSVRLMTNNPRKISELTELGVKVNGRVPCQIQVRAVLGAGACCWGLLLGFVAGVPGLLLGLVAGAASPPPGAGEKGAAREQA
jgi:GTP cyclohydrolase II